MRKLFDTVKNAMGIGPYQELIKQFQRLLESSVADGKVSEAEARQLREYVEKSGIRQEDVSKTVDAVFQQAVSRYIADRRLDEKERKSLEHLGTALGVSSATIHSVTTSLNYFGLLHYIETCDIHHLPAESGSNLVLKRGEIDHFSRYGVLLEERVVSRQMVGNSRGVSVRIMKGVSYRVGQSRGSMVSNTGIVPISSGELVITNQRIAFNGDRKSINAPLDKLQNIEMFSDGFRFSVTNRQKPVLIQLQDPQAAELAGLFLARLING